jgi:hypothetical protein
MHAEGLDPFYLHPSKFMDDVVRDVGKVYRIINVGITRTTVSISLPAVSEFWYYIAKPP